VRLSYRAGLVEQNDSSPGSAPAQQERVSDERETKWEGEDGPSRPEVEDDKLVSADDLLELLKRFDSSNHGCCVGEVVLLVRREGTRSAR
jgi:hypothetical protein